MRSRFAATSCRLRVAGWCAALVAAAHPAPAADLPFGWTPLPPATLRAPATRRVTLVCFDVQDEMRSGFAGVAEEVRSIFAELGVEVSWRLGPPGASYDGAPEPELAVIVLGEDPAPARRSRSILGLVQSDQRPTRNVWAFVNNIKRAAGLDPDTGRQPAPFEYALLSRALGRVIAHEVVHAVAPGHPHDRRGLMKHSLSRSALLGDRAPLGQDCARAVLAGLASWRERPHEPGASEVTVAGP